jgi:hypothetical protein
MEQMHRFKTMLYKAILIFSCTNLLAGEALLLKGLDYPNHITKNRICISFDSSIIGEYDSVVKNDTTPDYLCGYHWMFMKFKNKNEFDEYLVNKDCNKWFVNSRVYKHFMKQCGGENLLNPSHYLYNIKLPISISPELLSKKYSDEMLFQFDTLNCLPRIKFAVGCTATVKGSGYERANQKVEKEVLDIISKLKSEIASKYDTVFSVFENSSSGGGRGIEYCEYSCRIFFKYQENIENMPLILKKHKTKNIQVVQPEYYYLQAAFTEQMESRGIKIRIPEAISSLEYSGNVNNFQD